jgi:hypothetical protein
MYQEQLNSFILNGTYDYKLDVFGNLTIDEKNPSFETKYFKVGLYDFNYNVNKIEALNQFDFSEFIPTVTPPIDTDVNTSANYVESLIRASGSLSMGISQNGQRLISITPEILAELEYTIQQLKYERDDANVKLNSLVSQLTPPINGPTTGGTT